MSEILARIRVCETAGIRRFLYPEVVTLELPLGADTSQFQFIMPDGQPIPTEFQSAEHDRGAKEGRKCFSIRFALSLAPYEEVELALQNRRFDGSLLDDPLSIERTEDGGLENHQKRFSISLNKSAAISQVVYDGISHLKSSDKIELNGFVAPDNGPDALMGSQLALQYPTAGEYSRETPGRRDVGDFLSLTSLTACKSWANRYHWIHAPAAQDEVIYTLPLAITSPTLTCDFGVGGYVFGKLDGKAKEIVWRTEFGDAPYAKWTVATAGRVDYVGEVETAEAFLPQRWFHLIDSDKALAVAITKLPRDCQSMTVRLTLEGDVSVAFKLGDTVTGHAEFGVCYHFLNDVPAIAAATNPQSILLPPMVEVL
jgi:hypothetical protein